MIDSVSVAQLQDKVKGEKQGKTRKNKAKQGEGWHRRLISGDTSGAPISPFSKDLQWQT